MRTRHNLPDNLNPTGDKCYPLFIPDDIQWNKYVIRAIRTLTFDRHWERDDNNGLDALLVREQWENRTLQPLLDAMMNDTGCGGGGIASCYDINTTSDAVQYYPNNPFTGDDYDPVLFGHKWSRWNDPEVQGHPIWEFVEEVLTDIWGYYDTDVFVFPTDLPEVAFSGWGGLINQISRFWFPYLYFEFSGSGEIDLELLNFPLGGSCFIIPDADLTSWQGLLDTIIDIIDNGGNMPDKWFTTDLDRGIPFDSAPTQGQNVLFPDDGDHSLMLAFIPRIEPTNAPFIFPFGGFRRLEACGNITFTGMSTGTTISKNNAGSSEVQQRGFIMATQQEICDGVMCAMEKIAQRILLAQDSGNVRAGVEIDKDTGKVILSQAGWDTKTLPADITTLQKNSGSATYQASQFARLFDDMNGWITAGFTTATIQNLVRGLLHPTDSNALDTIVSAYIALNPQHAPVASALAESIYSAGDFYSGVYNYATTLNSETLLNDTLNFLEQVGSSVAGTWFDSGQSSPNDDYLDYDVTFRQTYTFTIDNVSTTQVNTPILGWTFSNPRLVRVSVSGIITRVSTGEYIDGVKRYNASGVIQANSFSVLTCNAGTGTLIAPSAVVTNAQGVAGWIIEVPNGNSMFAYKNLVNWTGDVSGSLTITIEDLGVAP